MKLTLQNIGIIRNSTIDVNGLTVVTGQNNSGKSTMGKVLYALTDCVANMKKNIDDGKRQDFKEKLERISDKYFLFRIVIDDIMHKQKDDSVVITSDEKLLLRFCLNKLTRKEVMEPCNTIRSVVEALKKYTFDPNVMLFKMGLKNNNEDASKFIDLVLNNEMVELNKEVDVLSELECAYQKQNFKNVLLTDALQSEFKGQIQPARIKVDFSRIILEDNGKGTYDLCIRDNQIVTDESNIPLVGTFDRAIFVDDLYVVDNYRRDKVTDSENNHNAKLKKMIFSRKVLSPMRRIEIDERNKCFQQIIDEIVPGKIKSISSNEYYVEDNVELRLENLATGSKMFAIIKQLLTLGFIDKNTLLILDEPEAHLHPKWQNAFAEVIVLMVKYLGTRVVLTSHSTNFVLALDAYRRKHDIENMVNFYHTKKYEDGMVDYESVSGKLEILLGQSFFLWDLTQPTN